MEQMSKGDYEVASIGVLVSLIGVTGFIVNDRRIVE